MEAIVLLLPSPYARGQNNLATLPPSADKDSSVWAENILKEVHICLTELSGARAPQPWQGTGRAVLLKQTGIKHYGDIGDGGMYM